jgi:hypothetical protein
LRCLTATRNASIRSIGVNWTPFRRSTSSFNVTMLRLALRAGPQDVENQLPQGKGDSELVQQVSAPESSMRRGDVAELRVRWGFGGLLSPG